MVVPVRVAPHWGAWIEIGRCGSPAIAGRRSHPTGVRGLKSPRASLPVAEMAVAPHWGAWIEIEWHYSGAIFPASHPTGVRGLKSREGRPMADGEQSHPTGVRGLKYPTQGSSP